MAIKRITLSVPEELATKIKQAAGEKPVSAWVTEKIEEDLNDAELERKWLEFYKDVNPSPEDEAWAQAAIDRLYSRRRRSDSGRQAA